MVNNEEAIMAFSVRLCFKAKMVFALLSAVGVVFLAGPAEVEAAPLKAGTYHCTTISASTFARRTPETNDPAEINRRAGGNKIQPMSPPQLFFGPAAFGNVIIDGKGGYRMPSVKQVGKYGFDAVAGRPTFTGDLGAMEQGYYSGTGTSFTVSMGEGLNFQCSLTGASATGQSMAAPIQPDPGPFATMGPVLASASAANYTGEFTGDYICGKSPSTLQLSLSALPDGSISGIFRFGGDRMAPMNYAVGAYSLKGRWQGSHFSLKSEAWIRQPDGYVMIDIEGDISDRGVFGKVLFPNCSTFTATKVP
jgi:hypothetical protein